MLKALAEKAKEAIVAIENGRPNREISQLVIEDIDELMEQIESTIFGESFIRMNKDIDIVQ